MLKKWSQFNSKNSKIRFLAGASPQTPNLVCSFKNYLNLNLFQYSSYIQIPYSYKKLIEFLILSDNFVTEKYLKNAKKNDLNLMQKLKNSFFGWGFAPDPKFGMLF